MARRLHRDDWLLMAQHYEKSKGLLPDPLRELCSKQVRKEAEWPFVPARVRGSGQDVPTIKPWIEDQGWRGWVKFNGNWHVYWWYVPCMFRKGHPGRCGDKLPDIFDKDGYVRPSVQRAIQRAKEVRRVVRTTDTGGAP